MFFLEVLNRVVSVFAGIVGGLNGLVSLVQKCKHLGAGTARRGGSTSVRRPLHLAGSWTAGCGFRWNAESAGAPER